METWKDIPGYEGLYQVSDLGNVKSLKRTVKGKLNSFRSIKERILSSGKNSCGYLTVVLYFNGKCRSIKVHQLVAMAFLNHTPCGHKLVCNHKNFDRTDNRLENIEIITQRENANLRHINSSSKYTGVAWDKKNNKWESYITIDRKRKRLGRFEYEFEAFMTYEKAKRGLTINT